MAEIYTVRSILGDESLQNLINQGKSQDEIISIAKSYKDEAVKRADKDALSRMNLVNQKQGEAGFFTRLGDTLDANEFDTLANVSRAVDIVGDKGAAALASLVGNRDKEAQILADMKLTQSINAAKNADQPKSTKEYMIDNNNILANAIGSYANDSQTYARNLVEEAQNNGYSTMDRFNIGMATQANAVKYTLKSILYGEDSKQAKEIKDAQKILQASRDAYEANNPDKWNIANFAGEMVTDPLNAVGLAKGFKVANTAFKKGANITLDLAQLGALGGIAGAISEHGSYKDKDEQNVAGAAAVGAISGVALGAGFMAFGAALSKIASRFGQKSTLEQNAQVAKDEAQKDIKENSQDINDRIQKISDDIEETFSADINGYNVAHALGQEYDKHINQAIKESQQVSSKIDDGVAEFASANPSATANDIERYINQTYTPSDSEKELTRIINDGKPVSPRMAGYRVLGVLKKSMEYKTRFDRNTIVSKFKNHGFSDELSNVFADAYIADDISVARNYLDAKVASNRDKSVDEIRAWWVEANNQAKTTKSNQAKTPKSQDEILKEISSGKTQFNLIDDADMTPELKSKLESDGYTLEREPESGVWEISKAISNEDIKGTDEALQNSTKDTPTPSTATKEVDNLSEATPNLTQNSIKGDGFVTYPNSARQETAINQNFNIQEWVKNMSGVISDEWRANLTKLAKKHPEMFRSEADVFRVIKEIKDNPTHFFKNYDDDVALIGKQINDNKFANIGIVKNDGEIIHANKNKIKDLDRLQRRNKEMLTGTPLPATTRANNSMGGDLLQHFNDKTIPNQSIKQAETAKEPNLSRAERRAMGIEEPKGKTLVIDEKAVKSDVREFGRLAQQVGLGFKSAKEAKAVMDKCDKSKFDCEG